MHTQDTKKHLLYTICKCFLLLTYFYHIIFQTFPVNNYYLLPLKSSQLFFHILPPSKKGIAANLQQFLFSFYYILNSIQNTLYIFLVYTKRTSTVNSIYNNLYFYQEELSFFPLHLLVLTLPRCQVL